MASGQYPIVGGSGGGGGSGTVTSVALSDGSTVPIFSVTGSPITIDGTLSITLKSQLQNLAFLSPDGSAGQPGFRSISQSDLGTILGTLSAAGVDGITVVGGVSAVIGGSGVQVAQHVASASFNGYLSSTDWSTFNAKQGALTFAQSITNTAGTVALTGDTASPGNSKYYGTDSGGTRGFFSLPVGTVTSVALSVPATSIFGVSGSPVTSSGTLGLTTTGTSGGIPYFSSTSQLTSSAALTVSQLIVGGGVGGAPATLAAGSQYQVLRMGATTPAYGSINLDQSAAVTGALGPANGGTGVANNAASTLTISGNFGTTLTVTGTTSLTLPTSGTVAVTANKLSVFAATTSAELAGVISDETGSGLLVFATSPTLTTPVLGVASATSINKVAITAPASSATLTIADGKVLTVSNTLTFTGTDSSSVAFGAGGTVSYLTLATQAEQETGTSTTAAVSPGRQQFHASACKCWVQFTSVTTTTILSSYNMTSLTDGGTGTTTIVIATDFSSTTYCTVGMSKDGGSGAGVLVTINGNKSAGQFGVLTLTSSTLAAADTSDVNVAMFGDQ